MKLSAPFLVLSLVAVIVAVAAAAKKASGPKITHHVYFDIEIG
jgi:hypothetical protein